MKINRYPGVKPFSADEQALFFGRDRDIADLCDLLRVEKTCVLFGKSGYGKSSILQAGVLPRLAAECLPIEVRFGEYIAGQSLPPLENLRLALAKRAKPNPETAFLKDLPDSLWVHFKKYLSEWSPDLAPETAQNPSISPIDKRSYLLVFDQFEEFFSYPVAQQRDFREQLATLLHDELPENLREAARALPREQRRLLASAPGVRLLLALRADRLHELDRMKDYLPTLLHKRYELCALSREQAREAVLGPASLAGEGFVSPAFSYAETALQRILADLSRSNTTQQSAGVEAFQLQILCDSIESRVAAGLVPDRDGDGLPDVMPEDLPDFSEVFGQYYERRLAQLPEHERAVARKVVEDGLVRLDSATGEGRRLSVDGDALLQQFGAQGLTPSLLRALEATFLLRREPNTLGGYNYELSHDTLLAPITAAAKERRQREEEQRLREVAELQRLERAKIERARRRNILFGLGALALLAFAFWKNLEAQKAQDLATQKTAVALLAELKAAQKDSLAKGSEIRANALLLDVETARAKIDQAEKDLALAQTATEAQKRLALKNLEEAERMGEAVVFQLLRAAEEEIRQLNYLSAAATLENARTLLSGRENSSRLGRLKPFLGRHILETAFFYVESDQYSLARTEIARASLLMEKPLPALRDLPWTVQPDPALRGQLRNLLQKLDPERYAALQARYYGAFVEVPGGAFLMGSETGGEDEKPVHEVTLSPFKMAVTETTWWQYHLFCTATGYPQPETPGWGKEGDNPVVNVCWYDAVLYANWRSVRAGLEPAYQIDSLNKDPNNQSDYDDKKWTVTPMPHAKGYYLPTEAEWEYAAQAAGKENYTYAGDSLPQNVAWSSDNAGNHSHPVASKKPNGLGLYDMSGNVEEWCWDRYGYYPDDPVKDYRGVESGVDRVARGGGWGNIPQYSRPAFRFNYEPDFRHNTVGFRLALQEGG